MRGARFDIDLEVTATSHVRRWVIAGAVLVIAGYTLVLALRLLTGQLQPQHFTEVAAIVGAATGLGLAVRHRVHSGAVVVIGVMWLELHVSAFQAGTSQPFGAPVLPLLIVAAGFFLGGRAAMIMASTSAVLYPIMVWLGAVAQSGRGVDRAMPLVILVLAMLAAGVLSRIGLSSFADVLQKALASQRKFSALAQNSPYGIVVLDARGGVESMNPEAELLLRTSDSEARHQSFSDVLARVALKSRSELPPFHSGSVPATELILASDEQRARINVECASSHTVLGDGSDGTQVILRDVTAQREAESKAANLARIYDESLSEAYAFDAETLRLSFVNRATRVDLGYELDEINALTVTDFNPALGPRRVRRLATELSGDPLSFIQERGVHIRKDGSSYPVELRMQSMSVEGRQMIAVLALDVTRQVESEAEQQRLRAQMQELQKLEAVGRLAGAVAHDFNNLLQAIGGYADMIRELSPDENAKDWAEGIREAQARGVSLTRGLLGFARKGEVRRERLSLSGVINDLEETIRSMTGERIELSLEMSERDSVYLDRGQLEKVILNLVSNAVDAMPEGGSLGLRVGVKNQPTGTETVVLEVKDTGTGMDETTRNQAFEPFFSTKPRGKGAGLGLSAVQGIVAQSGGTVELRSVPGQGTTVLIQWPAGGGEVDEQTVEIQDAPDRRDAALPGTVLVVEDDDSTRRLVKLVLERAGYSVRTAGNAAEALDLFREDPPVDLLVTDVVMPGRSGFDLGEDVQAQIPGLPVLYMSGYLDNLVPPNGGTLHTGIDLLLKPFSPSDLLDRVARALSRSG